jgi:tetratricopeptide (TPR) repeat protein
MFRSLSNIFKQASLLLFVNLLLSSLTFSQTEETQDAAPLVVQEVETKLATETPQETSNPEIETTIDVQVPQISPALVNATPAVNESVAPPQGAVTTSNDSGEKIASNIVLINELLSHQRDREFELLQKSNQFTLIMVGIIAATALISVLGVVYLQTRATSQALIKSYLNPAGALPNQSDSSSMLALHPEVSSPINSPIIEESNQKFISAVERLEKRIHDIEHISSDPNEQSIAQTDDKALVESDDADLLEKKAQARLTEQVTLILNKGQTLLNLDRLDEALECFDEAISLDSERADAFVKRGTALEKLQHVDEAISAYDQAIALDESLATAYLNKAGILNRLERYNEALECYEQALGHNKNRALEVV